MAREQASASDTVFRLREVWPRVLAETGPAWRALLAGADFETDEDGRLRVLVGSEVSYLLLKRRGVVRQLKDRLAALGFVEGVEIGWRSMTSPPPDPAPPVPAGPPRPALTVLLGSEPRGRTVPIREIRPGGEVLVRGRVFRLESRELKNGAISLRIGVTDGEDSVYLKLYRAPGQELPSEALVVGQGVVARGRAEESDGGEVFVKPKDLAVHPWPEREDGAAEKRIELHLHTKMSAMDSVLRLEDTFRQVARWGHGAVAVTDHGVVQAFPEAFELGRRYGVKVLYGLEAYLAEDEPWLIRGAARELPLSADWVAVDLETSGLSPRGSEILEIGAVRLRGDEVVERFGAVVRPAGPVPSRILELTGLSEAQLRRGEEPAEAFRRFREFLAGSAVLAHNAEFDAGFLRVAFAKYGLPPISQPILDTLALGRLLRPGLRRHRLDDLAKNLHVVIEQHHRAVSDAESAAGIWRALRQELTTAGVRTTAELQARARETPPAHRRSYHAVILATNQEGLERLYRLVSHSHLSEFHRHPRLPKSLLADREGLLLGSGCQAGELYRAILAGEDPSLIEEIARFYDYLEIQPLGNNAFLLEENPLLGEDGLREINRYIVELGEKLGKPVVATGDVHFLAPEDEIFRQVLQRAQGYHDTASGSGLYLKTTAEMLDEFSYLGPEKAREVVVRNPRHIAEAIPEIRPIPEGLHAPSLPEAEPALRRMVWENAGRLYGEPLPEPVAKRLEREMAAISTHGFSVVYYIAHRLVKKSLDDGYLVGSRGSVGSSLVATLAGITEVNPLPPHYRCPSCRYSDFEVGEGFGSGFDLPDRGCPRCGEALKKDGQNIPFETFLGFEGDKVPDIDLNFSGEYQSTVHRYTEELFGESSVFRAGTIATIAERTAYGLVKNAFEGRSLRAAEIDRLVLGLAGVKRTTGQHPGGLMIVPAELDVHRFTPIQHPADDTGTDVVTTHFDYHAISHRLLKLDILGHDDPTVLRFLEELTAQPVMEVPLDDPKTLALFSGLDGLGVTAEEIGTEVGTLGLPEFGTRFVRGMLAETRPKTFADLVRISGLSHGTDVWSNNAQELIRQGKASLAEVIATRDDIMVYLQRRGLPDREAFRIMEKVRKGQGLSPEDEELMRRHGVPDWYVNSCGRIRYMFPKAHAAAYVTMAVRIAHYKLRYPEAFYASYLTVRADELDLEVALGGREAVAGRIRELEENPEPSAKERNLLGILEVVREMLARGVRLLPVDLRRSDPKHFQPTPEGLLPPLLAVPGLGLTAAQRLVEARQKGRFLSLDDLRQRARLSQPIVATLVRLGAAQGLPAHDQLRLL